MPDREYGGSDRCWCLAAAPAIFADLNLDQVVAAVCALRSGYRLEPYFRVPRRTAAEVVYRQDVLADFAIPAVAQSVSSFARRMGRVCARQRQAAALR